MDTEKVIRIIHNFESTFFYIFMVKSHFHPFAAQARAEICLLTRTAHYGNPHSLSFSFSVSPLPLSLSVCLSVRLSVSVRLCLALCLALRLALCLSPYLYQNPTRRLVTQHPPRPAGGRGGARLRVTSRRGPAPRTCTWSTYFLQRTSYAQTVSVTRRTCTPSFTRPLIHPTLAPSLPSLSTSLPPATTDSLAPPAQPLARVERKQPPRPVPSLLHARGERGRKIQLQPRSRRHVKPNLVTFLPPVAQGRVG